MFQIEGQRADGSRVRVIGVPRERLEGMARRDMVLSFEKVRAVEFLCIMAAESQEQLIAKLNAAGLALQWEARPMQLGIDDDNPPKAQA